MNNTQSNIIDGLNNQRINEAAVNKELYDDLYKFAERNRFTNKWKEAGFVDNYINKMKGLWGEQKVKNAVNKVNKDFKRKKKVKSEPYMVFESTDISGVIGPMAKVTLRGGAGNVNLALSNLSLKPGWGDHEILNTIYDNPRSAESLASKLNAADWIVGNNWKKAAGTNDSKIRLIGNDTFGNKMKLEVLLK